MRGSYATGSTRDRLATLEREANFKEGVMIRCLAIVVGLMLVSGCAEPPTATPLPTDEPTATQMPTAEPSPTRLPPMTPSVPPDLALTATALAEQIRTSAPTNAPVPTTVPEPTGVSNPLSVSFTNLHYECHKACMQQGRPPHENPWAYRYLQLLMVIENTTSDLTVPEAWQPSKWVLTDGTNSWEETYSYRWTTIGHDAPAAVAVPPGAKVEWTFLGAPVPDGAWVRAVEYVDPWGNLYRQELERPTEGMYNWSECGEPRDGTC